MEDAPSRNLEGPARRRKAMDDARDAYRRIAYDPYQPGLRGWYDDSKPGAKEAKKAWLKAKREYEKAMSL